MDIEEWQTQDIVSANFHIPMKGDADFGKNVYLVVEGNDIEIQEIKCYGANNSRKILSADEFSLQYETFDSTLEEMLAEVFY